MIHVAENMLCAILIYVVAEVSSETHVCNGKFLMASLLVRKVSKRIKSWRLRSPSSTDSG